MKEIVTFFLSGKEYGVEVSQMQGIENHAPMTLVDDMPESLLGVVTIRDEIIPVLNIKKRLVLPPAGRTEDTKYIVFRTSHGKLACVADGVSQIFKADGEEVQEFPPLMKSEGTGYADFVAKTGNGLVIVMNPDNLLSAKEWEAVNKMIDNLEARGNEEDD